MIKSTDPTARTPPLRVLHVCQPVTGGVAQCVADYCADQAGLGWEVSIACPPIPYDSPLRGLVHRLWAATREPGPSTLAETRALSRIVRTARPDLVHLHSAKAGLAGRLAVRRRLPTVYQPHAWSFEAATGPQRRAALAWERFALRWADRVVTVSDAELARGLDEGVSSPVVVVVPNGVPVRPPLSRARARRLLGLPDRPTVICAGRLATQKGQDVLLAAWTGIRARVPEAALVVVGDGPQERELRAAAAADVVFVGAAPDVHAWLCAADVVAVPSRWEAMSLVLLEAMAAGRSVVASDVGAARSCLQPGAGEVVRPEDPDALAAALSDRLLDVGLADQEGATGRARVQAQFDITRTVPLMRSVYTDAQRHNGR